jgi:xylulokinase
MLLGLDLGTTNVKVVAVDDDGRIVADGSAPVQRYYTPDGGVEQDIEEIWDALVHAVRPVVAQLDDPAQIHAIGVSSQGGSLQLLDNEKKPLGRVISWLDGRGKQFNEQLTRELGEEFFVEHLGHAPSAVTPGQVLRLQQQTPEWSSKVTGIGYVGDVIVGRLCGRRAHDATSLSIAMLYNPSLGRADPTVLQRLQIREDQLPDLLQATKPAGILRKEAAGEMGLDAGIPISAAIHDQYAASLGAGSVEEGDVCLGTGTAWVLVANTPRPALPVTRGAFACCHPVPGLFGQMLSMNNGGSAIEWVARLLGLGYLSSQRLDEIVQSVPPTSDGLHFWPLLSASARANPFMEPGGRLAGVTLAHGPGHMVRTVLEGLACELARNLGYLTAAGLPVRRLILCGGAASSRTTSQIIADVVNRPVVCVTQKAVSSLGAAVIAQAMIQPNADLASLARQLTSTIHTVQPSKDARVYAQLLQQYLRPFANRVVETQPL